MPADHDPSPSPAVVGAWRVDELAVAAARRLTDHVGAYFGVPRLWERGIGDVTHQAVADLKLPQQPITPVALARKLGLLKPEGK